MPKAIFDLLRGDYRVYRDGFRVRVLNMKFLLSKWWLNGRSI